MSVRTGHRLLAFAKGRGHPEWRSARDDLPLMVISPSLTIAVSDHWPDSHISSTVSSKIPLTIDANTLEWRLADDAALDSLNISRRSIVHLDALPIPAALEWHSSHTVESAR